MNTVRTGWECPRCNAILSPDATFCTVCQDKKKTAPKPQESPKETIAPATKPIPKKKLEKPKSNW